MKAFKHVVRLTVLLAVCMLMVACPEPASDLGGGGSEFDIFLGFSQDVDAASRSTINDDDAVVAVYAKVYNSSGVHLPAIDATSDISGVTQLKKNVNGTWSATVILAAPASGTIGFEVWAVDESEYHVYEGGTTHTVGQNGNILTIPTHAVSTTYALRSTGPAGGLVFYDKGNYEGGWRYLEAAPADIMVGTDDYLHIFGYYRTTPGGASTEVGTGTGIGTGKANTEALVSKMVTMAYTSYTTSDTTTTGDYAARLCDIHLAGGYDDWFLPSRYELNQMYLNLKAQSVGGFSGYYWSSSEEGHLSAWLQSFSTGNQYDYGKYNDVNIRPARAF